MGSFRGEMGSSVVSERKAECVKHQGELAEGGLYAMLLVGWRRTKS